MDRDTFWKIVDNARSKVDDVHDIAPLVTEVLQNLEASDIIAFKQHQCDLLNDSYRWDLWAVASIINGGCSDDGFDYFRAWLMANGKDRWEAAMSVPETIGQWAKGDEEFELFDYVAIKAFESKFSEDFPYDRLTGSRPPEPLGEPWEEDDVDELYPALSAKFS